METKVDTVPDSATATIVGIVDAPQIDPFAQQKKGKKYILLAIFTLAQFLDAAVNSMLFPASPRISADLGMTGTQPSWIFAAYTATFSAFLLISGRVADIYTPKPVFIGGNIVLGCFALGTGWVRNKIGLFILRAFAGIGAAFTIPAAFQMVIRTFPDPKEQGFALAIFGSSAALAGVGGLLIGALYTQFRSWHWIFWTIAIIALGIAVGSALYIPNTQRPQIKLSIDLVGVSTVAVALILFIFAITQGSNGSWGTAEVIAPLIIAVFLMAAFFIWEWWIDEKNAALPPKLWFYDNVAVICVAAIFPYFWWISVLFLLTSWWQDKIHYTDVGVAVRFLPLGTAGGLVATVGAKLAEKVPSKWVALAAEVLLIMGTIFFPFADQSDRYWPVIFPGMLLGTMGAMILYVTCSIAIFQTTPPEVAGIVGAVFNCALQLGGALGVACVTSIQTAIDRKHPNKLNGYAGRAAAYWFVLACLCTLALATLVFYKVVRPKGNPESTEAVMEQAQEKERELEEEKSSKLPENEGTITEAAVPETE